MKKTLSLVLACIMLLGVSSAFADYPTAFPQGDIGGVYAAEIEAAMNWAGQKTDPDAPVWTGLQWQKGAVATSKVRPGSSDVSYNQALLSLLTALGVSTGVGADGGDIFDDVIASAGPGIITMTDTNLGGMAGTKFLSTLIDLLTQAQNTANVGTNLGFNVSKDDRFMSADVVAALTTLGTLDGVSGTGTANTPITTVGQATIKEYILGTGNNKDLYEKPMNERAAQFLYEALLSFYPQYQVGA